MLLKYVSKLNEPQIYQVQEHSHNLWSDGLSLEDRLKALKVLTAFGDQLNFAGLVDLSRNEIVCSLKRYSLCVTDQFGDPVKTIGIGAVFTPEEHRRKKHAESLIKLVLEEAANKNVSAALLFSDIHPSYYERIAGFREFPSWKFSGTVQSLKPTPPFQTRAANDEDIPWMIQAFDSLWPKKFLRVKRDFTSWKFYRLRNLKEPDLIISKDGKTLGYLSCHCTGSELFVNEFAPTNEENRDAMWSAVRQIAINKNIRQIIGWLPKNFVPSEFQVEKRNTEITMLASLNKKFELDSFEPQKTYFSPLDYF